MSGEAPPSARTAKRDYAIDRSVYSSIKDTPEGATWGYDDQGGASRFFYVAKADASERVRYTKPSRLRLRGDLTPEQVDHVRARLTEVGVQVD